MKRTILTLAATIAAGAALAQTAPGAQELFDSEFSRPGGGAAQPSAPPQPPPAAAQIAQPPAPPPAVPPASAQGARPPAAAAPAPPAGDDLSPRQLAGAQARVGGRYRTQGRNLNGAPYEGEAEISVTGRDKCRIVWRTGSSSLQRGVCMRSGYVFVAGYQFRDGTVGLITYEVQPDGVLKGMWTIADTDGRGTEVLTPLR